MYSLNIFKENNLQLNWHDVYWGLKEGIISLGEVEEYAEKHIDKDISNEIIQSIVFDKSSRNEILDKLGELVGRYIAENERKQRYEFSKRKWRYCILQCLANSNLDFSSMFDHIEQIYALFGYPEDMLSFIPYMPPQDNYKPTLHTDMENRNRLFNNLSVFLNTEKNFFKDNLTQYSAIF